MSQNKPTVRKRKKTNAHAASRFPQGMNVALIAMAILLVLALLFQKYGGTGDTVSKTITGNVIEGSPIRITEVMTSNSSAIADKDGDFPDWVELKNVTDRDVSLAGYLLSDSLNKDKFFTLPDTVVPAGSYLVVFCSGKTVSTAGQEIHTSFKLSSSGENLYLVDDMGNVRDAVEIPSMGGNYCYARDLTDGSWRVTGEYTPGYPNETQYYEFLKQNRSYADIPLRISEICASNKTMIADRDGDYSDWLEIRNDGSTTVALGDIYLSDNSAKPLKWHFPDLNLEPGQYILVFCSGKGYTDTELHTNFSLSSEKAEVVLSDASGATIDCVEYDLIPRDSTYGLNELGEFTVFPQGTPGYPNTATYMAYYEQLLSARNTTGLFIEEALASCRNSATEANPKSYDWIELHNTTGSSIDLSGWGLSDNPANPRKWQFPEGASVSADGRMVVYCSGLDTQQDGAYHTSFRLSSKGEILTLCQPDGTIVDRLPMGAQSTDISYGRVSGQSGFYYITNPTPGEYNNGDLYLGRTADVHFSVDGGLKNSVITVELSCADPDTVIYYTTDATTPTTASNLYTGPITLAETTVLRAVAMRNGYFDSFVTSETYIYNASHDLPVICLSTDPDNLFSEEKGLFVKGPNASDKVPYLGANYWQDWEYLMGFEYYTPEGEQLCRMNCGFKITGQYSRYQDQKSLGLYARTMYGENTFKFNPFDDIDFEEYHSFMLRPSGQDQAYTRIRDAVMTRLAKDTGVIYQSAAPVVLYINGQYWGHYNIRERTTKWMIAQHEGITDKNDIDAINFVKGNTTVLNGSRASYREVVKFVEAGNKLTNPDNLAFVESRIDIENYFKYVAMEIICTNSDSGNIKFYQVPGGKWKFMLYDLDWGSFDMKSYNYVSRYLHEEGHGAKHMFNNSILRALLEVDKYRDLFLQTIGEMASGPFSNENFRAEVESYKARIESEMPAHYARWGGSVEKWERYINTFVTNFTGYKKTLVQELQDYFDLSSTDVAYYFGHISFD